MRLTRRASHMLLKVFRPILEPWLKRHEQQVAEWQSQLGKAAPRGMVTDFNFWHRMIFMPVFRRVQVLEDDIRRIKQVEGPVVFVMKNRGQLEYRFFNHLFLQEGIPLVRYATRCLTVFWWPWRQMWQMVLLRVNRFYQSPEITDDTQDDELLRVVQNGGNALINLSVSRDYLFGIVNTDPLDALKPLVAMQRGIDQPLTLVSLQFRYDRHPDKSRKSLFDLMFGEKSRPGAIRKVLLFLLSLTRDPAVKFGQPLNLKDFLAKYDATDDAACSRDLHRRIEEDLHIEHARISGPQLKSKQTMIDEVLNTPEFRQTLVEFAMVKGVSEESVLTQARNYLEEIAADVSFSVVDFLDVSLTWMWNNIFEGLMYNTEGLNRIRSVAGTHPVVLVPMHRSHLDYLLISYIFYNNNLTFPHICAGINLNFWPVGRFIRKAGGFFIRRSFDGNAIYKETMAGYLRHLLSQRYCIEFFIEGTRSRTGKLLKPKMGVLGLIMRAFFEKACDDIHFVPIAINYDQIPEQKSYQDESKGGEKTSENAGQLLKAGKILGRRYGKVYIQFGEPVSLKSFCEDQNLVNPGSDQIKKAVSAFAYHLTYHINREAVITPIAMVALALLSLKSKSVSQKDLDARIRLFEDYLEYKQCRFSDVIRHGREWAYAEALGVLQSRHLIKKIETFEGGFYLLDDARRSDLDYYKNNILHFFVSLTCVAKIIKGMPEKGVVSIASMVRHFETLKTLFRADFTFSSRNAVEDHLERVLVYLQKQNIIEYDREQKMVTRRAVSGDANLATYGMLLDNFLESHLITLRYVKASGFQSLDRKLLIRDILEKARPLMLTGEFSHAEALSQFNLENSLKMLSDIGIIRVDEMQKGKPVFSVQDNGEPLDRWMSLIQVLLRGALPGVICENKTAHSNASPEITAH